MDLPQEFAVDDLYMASYMKARGMKLIAVQKDGRRSLFVFQDVPERGQIMSDYHGAGEINAFIHALKDLKAAIHNWNGVPSERSTDVHKRWR